MDILSHENQHLLKLRSTISLQLDHLDSLILDNRKNMQLEKKDLQNDFSPSVLDKDKNLDNTFHVQAIDQFEQSYQHHIKLKNQLTRLYNKPYFAKIALQEGTNASEEYCIGLTTLADEETHDIRILDWRSPIASTYYQFNCGPCHFDSPEGRIHANMILKRQFLYTDQHISEYIEDHDSYHDNALISYLSRKRNSQLQQVVSTIQKEQDDLIRKTLMGDTVIEGPAGSGKTIIAYHRIAHQMYKFKDSPTINQRFYMIGPGKQYFDHTLSILDELGEDIISHSTLDHLYLASCEHYQLNNHKDEVAINIDLHRIPTIEDANKVIDDVLSSLPFDDVYFFDHLIMPKEKAIEFFTSKKFQPHHEVVELYLNNLRSIMLEKRKTLFNHVFKHYVDLDEHPFDGKAHTRLTMIKEQHQLFKRIKKAYSISYEQLVDKFILEYNVSTSLPLNGVYFYFYLRLHEIKKNIFCREVIIDEAQDLNVFDIYNVKRIFPKAKLLLIGDRYQSMINPGDTSILSTIKARKYQLLNSYRSTYEIVNFSKSIIAKTDINPLPRFGPKVDVILTDKLSNISFSDEEHLLITFNDITHTNLPAHVEVLPVNESKGLEYSNVYIFADDSVLLTNDVLRQSFYVAATRALHSLTIITTSPDLYHQLRNLV